MERLNLENKQNSQKNKESIKDTLTEKSVATINKVFDEKTIDKFTEKIKTIFGLADKKNSNIIVKQQTVNSELNNPIQNFMNSKTDNPTLESIDISLSIIC